MSHDKPSDLSILIVDDEPVARTLLRLVLVREGFNVLEAEDGDEALKKMHQKIPDVVVLDVMMPGMDGFAVCATMAESDTLMNIPVIMLSAKTDVESRQRGLDVGAKLYLTKPITPNILKQYIYELIDR